MTMQRRACVAGLLALALCLTACDKAKPTVAFKGTDITGANYGKNLSLPDQDGKVRTLADFQGKLVVVFFGFTQCPDVCPTTMAELAAAKKLMGADGDKVQGIFISVDPERDTPEILKSYATAWDPSFIALRGTPEQTTATAKEFKVFFAKVPGKEPGSYTIDHSAASFVFDTQGQLRLYVRYGAGAEALAFDLKALLAG
jgi:protein SCO1/2